MSAPYTPPPPGMDVGPLRRRSVVGLVLQSTLQWCYLVPGGLLAVGDMLSSLLGNGSGDLWKGVRDHTLTRRRYHLERRGTEAEWAAWADERLERLATAAIRTEREHRAHNQKGGRYRYREAEPSITVEKRYYRGIGAAGLAAVAARRGWDVDWQHTDPTSSVKLVYRHPLAP
ncbi:hypothetical protein ACIQGZ_14785 [Streptomyces sp. NPDC092296]|uniref:hypothetical protein n=1 Tax=Streptomyces sp. NPDC092296 TaxID=3366012 RepID=UPI0037FB5A4F